ncbi:MAG: nucleotidyltransferase family protein [Bacteroidales bacterium]|nr:nucleotidyltransferase family protein [Bacteroidales bacterium]
MERHEEVFFSLLRNAFWGTPVEIPEGFADWGKVARTAKIQSALGVAGDIMLSDTGIASAISQELRTRIKTFIMANIMTHGKLNGVLVNVVSQLSAAGIRPVLLKGQGLAQYYPKPELRQCGDIDLYVGLERYSDSYDVVKPLATQIDDRKALEVGKHYDFFVGKVAVEMHRYSDRYPTSRLDRIYQEVSLRGLNENLVPLVFSSQEVYTPSDEYNAFYIFSHLFHHFLINGLGARQLCDWMLFLRSRSSHIDMQSLKTTLGRLDMLKPWQAFGCVLVKYFGMPADSFPFYDAAQEGKAAKIVKRLLNEGNFGKERDVYKKRGKIYIINKTWAMFAHIGRSLGLLFLFPRHSFRQIWHTISNGFAKVWNDTKIRFGL